MQYGVGPQAESIKMQERLSAQNNDIYFHEKLWKYTWGFDKP